MKASNLGGGIAKKHSCGKQTKVPWSLNVEKSIINVTVVFCRVCVRIHGLLG